MWFKPKYSICSECKVHFEPDNCDKRFAHLCITHRKPVMERELRKDAVMYWAAQNWEKLEEPAKENEKKQSYAYANSGLAGLAELGRGIFG